MEVSERNKEIFIIYKQVTNTPFTLHIKQPNTKAVTNSFSLVV